VPTGGKASATALRGEPARPANVSAGRSEISPAARSVERRGQPRPGRRQLRLEAMNLDERVAELVVGERVRVEPSERIDGFSE
jgi:hypothetical protein